MVGKVKGVTLSVDPDMGRVGGVRDAGCWNFHRAYLSARLGVNFTRSTRLPQMLARRTRRAEKAEKNCGPGPPDVPKR